MTRGMLTDPQGPVVTSSRTLSALLAIRREKLLASVHGQVLLSQSSLEALKQTHPAFVPPEFVQILADEPQAPLPARITSMEVRDPLGEAAIRLALHSRASIVLLENPIKEKAKLSYIKSEGALSILVTAYRRGLLSSVQAMVKAWKSLGYHDVLPDEQKLDALWKALEQME